MGDKISTVVRTALTTFENLLNMLGNVDMNQMGRSEMDQIAMQLMDKLGDQSVRDQAERLSMVLANHNLGGPSFLINHIVRA